MPYSFETITCVTLKPQSTLGHPTTPPELVKLDSPAAAVMTPQPDICALEAQAVRDARVGDIIETLRAQERQHALVVKTDKATQSQRVIGMFSTSQIDKLLGYNVTPEVHPARSLAALVEQIA